MDSLPNSTRHTKGAGTTPLKIFQTIQREGNFPNHFMKPTSSRYQNPEETQQKKKTSGQFP